MQALFLSERLAFTTVRITANGTGGGQGIGTGFLFRHVLPNGNWYPALYTNKHVVEGSDSVTLHFNLADSHGAPVPGRYYSANITDTSSAWIDHPDDDVDLCAMPFGGLIHILQEQGIHLFLQFFDDGSLVTEEEEQELRALESIIMVGYPIGLWDSLNNRPVMRRGVTATHPAVDFEGRTEFMIDAACFPGSSGSPIVLYSEMGRQTRDGSMMMGGPSARLLGILYAGPQFIAEGMIRFKHIPMTPQPVAESPIPMNLGMAIKARRVRDLEPALAQAATRT